MTLSILRRLILAVAVLLAVNAATFLVVYTINMRWMDSFRGDFGIESEIEPLSAVVGHYGEYLGGLLQGDSGVLSTGRPVGPIIATALPKSLILLSLSLIIAAVLGVLGGLLSVDRATRRVGPLALVISLGGFAMPGFFIAILLMYVTVMVPITIGGKNFVLPVTGYGLDAHLVLPLIALSMRPAAEVARLTAELLAGELDKNYIRAARAKGLPWRLVLLRHAFRNVAATVVVTLGNGLRYLISSLMVIEWMYQWPGLGRLLAVSVYADQAASPFSGYEPALMAGILATIAGIFLITNAITDVVVGLLDPRLRRHSVEA